MRMHYNKSDVKSWSCMKIRRNLDFWPEKMFVWVEKVHSLCPIVIWQSSFHLALHWFWKTTHSFVLDWRFTLFFCGFFCTGLKIHAVFCGVFFVLDWRFTLFFAGFLYWTEDSRVPRCPDATLFSVFCFLHRHWPDSPFKVFTVVFSFIITSELWLHESYNRQVSSYENDWT